ncbi:MAG: hypothetical protein SPL46_09475 [Selenomonadaceae bacterium]|nr:hypothetical protein [Selenomonadaceae bacterium]
MAKTKKFKREELHSRFIDALGDHVECHSDLTEKPFLVDLKPRKLKLRVYLWNCTNPPGGRPLDEYKIQVILPAHKTDKFAHLDYSEGRTPIIGGIARDGEDIVFVLWDADKHDDIPFSMNLQVKADVIIRSLCEEVTEAIRKNDERIVCARPQFLYDAIIKRMDISEAKEIGD